MSRQDPNGTTPRGTDGDALDLATDFKPTLPNSLVRLPSGMIAVTQVFCPNGHNLVDPSSTARFNRFPGIVLRVEGRNTTGKVVLSPIHGDDTKFGESDFVPGEITRISCPLCGTLFPVIQPCGCAEGSELVALYLDENLTEGNQVVVCTAWGCLRSRIMDRFQVISKFE